MNITDEIKEAKIIPIIVLEDAEDITPVCEALRAGGLSIAEITFRTPCAREALSLARTNFPDFILGAGTVTKLDELGSCVDAGAQFAVSPGLNPSIVNSAREIEFPFFPGVCTPTEVEKALGLGCEVLKFFPAQALGGVKILKAVYGPYKHRGIQFIPTGGINAENLESYISLPGVLAVGGSWLTPKNLIKEKAWHKITELTRQSLSIVKKI